MQHAIRDTLAIPVVAALVAACGSSTEPSATSSGPSSATRATPGAPRPATAAPAALTPVIASVLGGDVTPTSLSVTSGGTEVLSLVGDKLSYDVMAYAGG